MPGDNYRYDLRSTAIDRKRDRETKRKWGNKALNGQREGRTPTPGTDKARPFNDRQMSTGSKLAQKRGSDSQQRHATRCVKDRKYIDMSIGSGRDSSGSGDNSDLWSEESVPEDEQEILYSYDAQRGPASGRDIFGNAVGRAVTRFEDGVTSRLVKDEYDILDDAADEGDDENPGETVEEDFQML